MTSIIMTPTIRTTIRMGCLAFFAMAMFFGASERFSLLERFIAFMLGVGAMVLMNKLESNGADSYSEKDFEDMAKRQPAQLAGLIASNTLPPSSLTFAAEILGRHAEPDLVIKTLLPLLSHEFAIVREGAIYGLAHATAPEVREALSKLANDDSSRAVRTAAADALS